MAIIVDFRIFDCDNIVFDVSDVDLVALKDKLIVDEIDISQGFSIARYITFWNNSVQGFINLDNLYFPSTNDTYDLAKLVYLDDKWLYKIVEHNKQVNKRALEHVIEKLERERKERRIKYD